MERSRPGPIYFFDQPSRDGQKRPQKSAGRPLDLIQYNHPYFASDVNRYKPLVLEDESENEGDFEDDSRIIDDVVKKGSKRDRFTGINKEHSAVDSCRKEVIKEQKGAPVEENRMMHLKKHRKIVSALLFDLGQLLHKCQRGDRCFIPRGLLNILSCPWRAGEEATGCDKRCLHSTRLDTKAWDASRGTQDKVPESERNDTKGTENRSEEVRAGCTSFLKKKTDEDGHKTSQPSTTVGFSISSEICKDQGWIIQPEEPSSEDPHWQMLYQWVLERLQLARRAINEQNEKLREQGFTTELILRHYGDNKKDGTRQHSRVGGKTCPFVLHQGRPRIPRVTQRDPLLQKLHYRIDDGSSFVYYPSGRVAVCQTHSGLPSGGFYTNVFGDTPHPSILATFSALGQASVTQSLRNCSGTMMVTWNQDGGFVCDPNGTVTREWTWIPQKKLNMPIVIQVNELITVQVWSRSSAAVWFRAHQETVRVPITPLPNQVPPNDPVTGNTSSDITDVTGEGNSLGMAEETQSWVQIGRHLRQLQQKAHSIADSWLQYYCIATGLKMLDTPPRIPLRRQVQSVEVTFSRVGIERPDSSPPPEGSNGKHTAVRHLSAPANMVRGDLPSCSRFSRVRSSWKTTEGEQRYVSEAGALRVYSNNRLDALVLPKSAEITAPSPVLPGSSAPCPPCPSLLRAGLLRRTGCTLCHCSAHQMPVLTDLEYDAFISSQASRRRQILVVCISAPSHSGTTPSKDVLEELYRKRNRKRTMPCTQCYLDHFRMVRYEVHIPDVSLASHNALLQQRHNVAPGMFLMYLRGKLLFADHIFSGFGCSVMELLKQIAIARESYSQGQCLPPDFWISPQVGGPVGETRMPSAQTLGEQPLVETDQRRGMTGTHQ